MRLFMGLLRTSVILLLTLRVLASPLAMRPESPRFPTNYRLIARVCAWPALRPQRSISPTSLVPRCRCKGPNSGQDPDYAFGPRSLLSSARAMLTRLIGPVSQGWPSVQHPVHLRC
jgi:hypothetical protein